MKVRYGLLMREEIHAAKFLTSPGSLTRIPMHDRVAILRAFTSELAGMTDFSLINIRIDKQGKPATFDVFNWAWKLLFQRFENGMTNRNFNGPQNADERGIVIPDKSDEVRITRLLRRIRRFNPIANAGNNPIRYIVEDPNFRNSEYSYFVQCCDLATYLLKQKTQATKRARRYGVDNFFDRLDPILYKHANNKNVQGIVDL